MTKISVETTGDFILQDITNGVVIEAQGSTEVEKTGFIDSQIEKGTLKESTAAPRHEGKDTEQQLAEAAEAPKTAVDGERPRQQGRKGQ